MAEKKLSPRQRMINMMYLVLTALLALNVSKEVLNSFFEVNTGIERTTTNFTTKNNEVYTAFDNAVFNNPEKFKSVRDDAYSIKNKADFLVETIQEMKYSLVLDVDGGVYLGNESLDKEGKPIKDKRIELSYSELSSDQKSKSIAYLYNKKNRTASGELLIKTNKALDLKNAINEYKNLLISFSSGNPVIQSNLETTLNTEDRKTGKKGLKVKSWEEYNFDDMPSVGAVTLLSKMQSDIRNTEADVIKLLKESIDVGSLKFTSAEAIQIPNSSFVLRGDSFKADIFISAKDTTQDPIIYVGEYDSLGNGQYQMRGEYETVRVVNGKGLYAKKVVKEGAHEWGGLISMKTETGTKMFPFKGTYLGANKTAVVSPVNMNILYQQVDNPLKISVPGFAATDVTPMINNGSIIDVNLSTLAFTCLV